MVAFLSQGWCDAQRSLGAGLPERPGASARLQVVVTGAPSGEVHYVQHLDDGRIVACALGDDPEADVTLTQTYADALLILQGELDPSAAFMQGRVKVAGNMGRLMGVLPVLQSHEHHALTASLAAQTEL